MWFERKWLPKGIALLGGMALLEYIWPSWRKYVTVGVGFEVSYAQATSSETMHLLLPPDQDVAL